MEPLELTTLIHCAEAGDEQALARLMETVPLDRLARSVLAGGPRDPLLETGVLQNEAFLRLFGKPPESEEESAEPTAGDEPAHRFNNTKHFISAMVQAMRHICYDHYRRLRNGEFDPATPARGPGVGADFEANDLKAKLDKLLGEMEKSDPQAAFVFILRVWGKESSGGAPAEKWLDISEVVRRTGLSRYKVDNAWSRAKRRLRAAFPELDGFQEGEE